MKPGMTSEQHWFVGFRLHAIRNSVLDLLIEIGRAYPKQGRQVKHLERALRQIESCQSDMEARFFAEHPREASIDAYYPVASANRAAEGHHPGDMP